MPVARSGSGAALFFFGFPFGSTATSDSGTWRPATKFSLVIPPTFKQNHFPENSVWGIMIDPAEAKLAPIRRFIPDASGLRYGGG